MGQLRKRVVVEKEITKKKIKRDPDSESAAPTNWEIVYNKIEALRDIEEAPVDTMGCERLAQKAASAKDQRFQTLIALMLSSQTKDTVTSAAVIRLQNELPKGLCLESILEIDANSLDQMIRSVGFHTKKSVYIKKTAEILRDIYDSDIPDTIEGLVGLPGVGPKMGYLVLQVAWDKNLGIGVDVHVHRIANRLGWVSTKTPEETRVSLQSWLPKDKWKKINPILVGYGQIVCLPRGPRCSVCPVSSYCPSSNIKVKRENFVELNATDKPFTLIIGKSPEAVATENSTTQKHSPTQTATNKHADITSVVNNPPKITTSTVMTVTTFPETKTTKQNTEDHRTETKKAQTTPGSNSNGKETPVKPQIVTPKPNRTSKIPEAQISSEPRKHGIATEQEKTEYNGLGLLGIYQSTMKFASLGRDLTKQSISTCSLFLPLIDFEPSATRKSFDICYQNRAFKMDAYLQLHFLKLVDSKDEIRGRYVSATDQISKGELIIASEPLGTVILPDCSSDYCHYCFRRAPHQRCSKCKAAYFCNADCFKKAWVAHHQFACGQNLDPEVEMLEKVSLNVQRYKQLSAESETTPLDATMEAFFSLMNHYESQRSSDIAHYKKIASTVLQRNHVQSADAATLVRYLCAFSANNFMMDNSEMFSIGQGTFPIASLFNHSCTPNAVISFDGASCKIRAIAPIDSGTEITIAYLDIAHSRSYRKQALKKKYFFTCACARCQGDGIDLYLGEEEDAWEKAAQLLSNSNNDRIVSIQKQVEDWDLGRLSSETVLDPSQSLSCYTHYFINTPDGNTSLPKNTEFTKLTTLSLCSRLFYDAMAESQWGKAARLGTYILVQYTLIYPEYHPMLAQHYLTLAKANWNAYVQEDKKIYKSYGQRWALCAEKSIPITFGKGSTLWKELLELKSVQ
ncbi:hypothetical protein BY458DRAFT_561067 [Sporodiniella umbellata]|nr:hypothetical protein BY458DRAFT_561067 [Sporodiniella umbellata]